MKKALLILTIFVLAFAPACKKDSLSPSAAHNVKISISYEPPNITINAPVPDPAKIAKGDTVNWVVTVTPGTPTLDVTIDDFKDGSGKPVDVFGDGSTYRFGGVGSAPTTKPSGPAGIVSDAAGFKYNITAVSATGDKKVLDPRIIVSAGLAP